MARLSVLLLAAGMLLVSLTGCFYSREMARTRDAIEEQYPEARLRKQAPKEVEHG